MNLHLEKTCLILMHEVSVLRLKINRVGHIAYQGTTHYVLFV